MNDIFQICLHSLNGKRTFLLRLNLFKGKSFTNLKLINTHTCRKAHAHKGQESWTRGLLILTEVIGLLANLAKGEQEGRRNRFLRVKTKNSFSTSYN